jgi:UDP-N-acetylmuramyl pentapeptide phosphotransferase/UDP-N-acetylglucosamine-1-phosphate transferase
VLILKILIAALTITRVTASLGARLGLLDSPGARKQHQGDVPLTGGIALFFTLLFGTFVNVGNLLAMGDIPLLLLTVPLTSLALAGLSNAYNMIDGIDGLAASTITLPLLVLIVGYAIFGATAGMLLEGVPEYLSLLCYFLLFCGHCLFVLKAGTPQCQATR